MDVHGGGSRLAWTDLPVSVRTRIEELVGGSVIATTTAAGGFSPGLAVTAALSDGRTVFVKAVGRATGPGSAAIRGSVEENAIFHFAVQATPRLRAALCARDLCDANGVPVALPAIDAFKPR